MTIHINHRLYCHEGISAAKILPLVRFLNAISMSTLPQTIGVGEEI